MNCCTNLAGSFGCIGFKRAIDFLRSISYITETASYSAIAYRFHKSRSGRCYFLISLFCFFLDGVFCLLDYLLWMGHCILHPFSSRFYSTDDCFYSFLRCINNRFYNFLCCFCNCFYSFLCCTLNPAPQGMSCRIIIVYRIIGCICIAVSGQWIFCRSKVTIFSCKGSVLCVIVSCPQILKSCFYICGLPVVTVIIDSICCS